MPEHVTRFFESAWAAIAASVVGAGIWVIRRVLTNQQELAMTRETLTHINRRLERIEDAVIKSRTEKRG